MSVTFEDADLNRKALELMERRGWWTMIWLPDGYRIENGSCDGNGEFWHWLDKEQQPQEDLRMAWINADEWYTANIEGGK